MVTSEVAIILLDVMMPGMTGFELCAKLKGSEEHRHIPIVLLTALTAKEARIKGIEAGADDFISKPLDYSEVLARTRMLLKARELHDNLANAHAAINSLTEFGKTLVETFDPMRFERFRAVDGLVDQIVRKDERASNKPSMIVLGMREHGGGSSWQFYQWQRRALERSALTFGNDETWNITKDMRNFGFFNQTDMATPESSKLRNLLAALEVTATDAAYSFNYDLCLIAINFGRAITRNDLALLENLLMQLRFMGSLSQQIIDLEDAFTYTVHALARAAEANDEDTGNHILRVGEFCAVIATELGCPEKLLTAMRTQTPLHDVGKIHIHPDLLRKRGKLTDEEFAEMQQHVVYGAKIIGAHPRLEIGAQMTISHHEKWDGSGYPFGLRAEQIPLAGRIMTIADQYDALRSHRPYKPALDHDTVFRIITAGDGRTMPHHFDPQVLAAFRRKSSLFGEIYDRLP
ncbi:MAG: 3'3'-cGAMP-specific phosphodiesterase 2 [Firmicutes bacterium]|nr:3'3'-cGAMP-specific phosphodiesterase 2 [candidate division NPL-UPA2 bacterium]